MNAIERLRGDHDALRATLYLLEGALGMGPETRVTLRKLCHVLGGRLRDHIQREDALVSGCRQAFGPEILRHLAVEHHDEPQLLRALEELFAQDAPPVWTDVTSTLTRVIQGLRRHLAEEEQELFPTLERAFVPQARDPGTVQAACPACLCDTMTPNWIVRQDPRTQAVFDELSINLAFEGSDGLDEVAWRHGVSDQELLQKLEEATRETSLRSEHQTAP